MSRRQVIMVRYGEIGLKGGNRRFFERALLRDLKRVLRDLNPSVEHHHGRLLVHVRSGEGEALQRVSRVFGVVSASRALEIPADLDEIKEAVQEVVREEMKESHETFRVSARRSDKSFSPNSQELNRVIGAHILENTEGLGVDLTRPDLDVGVEVRDRAYVFAHRVEGPGGLPIDVSGRGLLLLSGGIDSPVAGWLCGKRGLKVDAVHFESFPFTGQGARQKAVDLARLLSLYVGPLKLHLAHFTEVQRALAKSCPDDLGTILMRRQMIRISERLAGEARCLITGESIGQVASQTLEALACTDAVASLPVIRPLVTWDKTEIVDLARRIGSYEISIRPFEDCCTLFVPKSPRTRPSLRSVEKAERALDLHRLIEDSLDKTETLDIQESWEGPLGRSVLSQSSGM